MLAVVADRTLVASINRTVCNGEKEQEIHL